MSTTDAAGDHADRQRSPARRKVVFVAVKVINHLVDDVMKVFRV